MIAKESGTAWTNDVADSRAALGTAGFTDDVLQQNRELVALYAVTSILNHSFDLEILLKKSLEEIVKTLELEAAAVFLRSEGAEDTRYELHSHSNLSDELASFLKENPPRHFLSDADTSEPRSSFRFEIDDADRWEKGGAGDLVPCCLLPMDKSEHPTGVLAIFRNASRGCYFNELVLSEIARQMGVAVEKTELFEFSKKQAHDMERLYHASLGLSNCLDTKSAGREALHHAMRLSGARRGVIYLLNKRGKLKLIHAAPDSLTEDIPEESRLSECADWILHNFSSLSLCGIVDGHAFFNRGTILVPDWHASAANYLGVPLVSRGRTIGILEVSDIASERFSAKTQRILETLAHQAAVCIENIRLLEEKSNIADVLQRSLLPSTPSMPDLDIGSVYASATRMAAVGGDFYDFFEAGKDKVAVVCGDVCGKGIEAATTTAMVRYLIRSLVDTKASPASVIYRLNRALCAQLGNSQFVTLFYGLYDRRRGTLNYINCGHPPPVLWKVDSRVELLHSRDIPLGLFNSHQFHQHKVSLDPGETLLLYTDGVTEARAETELFGQERLLNAVARNIGGGSAEALARSIYMSCARFARGELNDDIAIVAMRRLLPKKSRASATAAQTRGNLALFPDAN